MATHITLGTRPPLPVDQPAVGIHLFLSARGGAGGLDASNGRSEACPSLSLSLSLSVSLLVRHKRHREKRGEAPLVVCVSPTWSWTRRTLADGCNDARTHKHTRGNGCGHVCVCVHRRTCADVVCCKGGACNHSPLFARLVIAP